MIYNHLGNYSLVFSLIFSLLIFFLCFKNASDNSNKIEKNIYYFLFLQLLTIIISFFCLIILFVLSDFSNETVYNHSNTKKPIFYKISGSWGNHEGSLLLWLFVLVLFIFIFFFNFKKTSQKI